MNASPASRPETSREGPQDPAVPVLPGMPYDTLYGLLDDLNAWGRSSGFGFIKTSPGNYVSGVPTYAYIVCDRGGHQKKSKATTRRTTTLKTGCEWTATAKSLKKNDRKWALEVKNTSHNHEADADEAELVTHRVHRGLTDAMKATVQALSLNPAQRPRDIFSYLLKQFPNEVFTLKDINNYRQRLQEAKYDGLSPTQALIRLLEDRGIYHVVRKATGDPDRVIGLFWTFEWCTDMWKRFPHVIQIDNTYKTNRFKMPLFEATGVTNVSTNFPMAFGLVDNEREDGFKWLAQQLEAFRASQGVQAPGVVITNDEMALKTALKAEFPGATQQLCLFHVNKNVVLNIKRKWKKPPSENGSAGIPVDGQKDSQRGYNAKDEAVADPMMLDEADKRQLELLNAPCRADQAEGAEGGAEEEKSRLPDPGQQTNTKTALYALWKSMVYATDEALFDEAWSRLKSQFFDQEAIIAYLEERFLRRKEEWAGPWISRNANFGQRTTSPTESSQKELKGYLIHGRSNLYKLVEVVMEMLDLKKAAFEQKVADQKLRLRHQYLGPGFAWLGNTNREVARKAIDKLNVQRRLAVSSQPNRLFPAGQILQPCTGTFSRQWGMPCAHQLLPKLARNEIIVKEDFHRVWWLKRSLDNELPILQIKEPEVVKVLKGRPRGAGPFAAPTTKPASRPAGRPSSLDGTGQGSTDGQKRQNGRKRQKKHLKRNGLCFA